MTQSPQNPFDTTDPVGEFMRNAAKEVLKDLKESLVGKKNRRKRDKKPKQSGGATIVEVMACGLQYRTKRDVLEKEMRNMCRSKILHDLAEFEILETRVVDQWLVIFHFSFLSPLPPEAAYYETDVALNQEADHYGLLGYRVQVHG